MARLKVEVDTRSAKTSIKSLDKDVKSFAKNAKKVLGKIGTSFKAIGKGAAIAGAAIVAAGIGSALYALNQIRKESVDLANIQDAAETKLAAVLRATGEAAGFTGAELKKVAGEMQGLTTVGDEAIINTMAVIATFKEIKGDNFKAATMAVLDMAKVLDTDLKSASIQVGKALNDPIKGVSALGRAGVQFTESQKDMIKSLQESGDLIGAQTVILKELESQFGGAAAAARGTFAGSLTALSNAWGDMKEQIGFVITRNGFLIDSLGLLEKYVIRATTYIEENRGEFLELSKTIAISVVGALSTLITIIEGFYNAWVGLKLAAQAAIYAIATGFQMLVKTVRLVLAPVDLLLTALEKLGVIDVNPFDSLEQGAKDMRAATGEAITEILSDTDKMGARFAKAQGVLGEFKDELGSIEAVERDPLASVAEGMKKSSKGATDAMTTDMQNYAKEATKSAKAVSDTISSVGDDIQDITRGGMSGGELWEDLTDEIRDYKKAADEAGRSGNLEAQQVALQKMAALYKALPSDGVKGAAPTTAQLSNAQRMVDYWREIKSEQTTMSGAYTYDLKLKAAKDALYDLQQQEKNGGVDIVSVEEARRIRLEGLKTIQQDLITLQGKAKTELEGQVKATDALGDFDTTSLIAGKDALVDMDSTMEDISEPLGDMVGEIESVGTTWGDVTTDVLKDLGSQVDGINLATDAVIEYIRRLNEAQAKAASTNSGSSGGTSEPLHFATGGVVPGVGTTDSVSAMLTPSEGVVTPIGMDILTPAGLAALNVGRNPFAGPENDTVTMDFRVDQKKISTLSGERRMVSQFVNGMSNVRRSLS